MQPALILRKKNTGTEQLLGDTDSVSTFRANQTAEKGKGKTAAKESTETENKSASSDITMESRVSIIEHATKGLREATSQNTEQLSRMEKQISDFIKMMTATNPAAAAYAAGSNQQ